MTEISFDAWQKLDLRVGEIKEVEDHPNADKVYLITVDLGNEERKIVSGLKDYYEADDLVGRKIIVLTNLAAKELRGVESKGMLLAAGSDETNTCVLLQPEQDIENGAKVS